MAGATPCVSSAYDKRNHNKSPAPAEPTKSSKMGRIADVVKDLTHEIKQVAKQEENPRRPRSSTRKKLTDTNTKVAAMLPPSVSLPQLSDTTAKADHAPKPQPTTPAQRPHRVGVGYKIRQKWRRFSIIKRQDAGYGSELEAAMNTPLPLRRHSSVDSQFRGCFVGDLSLMQYQECKGFEYAVEGSAK